MAMAKDPEMKVSGPAPAAVPAAPEDVRFVVLKGNPENIGASVKQNSVQVMLDFMAMCGAARFTEGRFSFMALMQANPREDPKWVEENVIKYVSLVGTAGAQEAASRARMLYDRYMQIGGAKRGPIGPGLFRRFLESIYAQYDVWGPA